MCDKEFESRQYLQQHILVNHSGIPNAQSLLGLLPGGIPLPFMLSPGLQQSLQMQDMDQNGMLAGLNGQLSNPVCFFLNFDHLKLLQYLLQSFAFLLRICSESVLSIFGFLFFGNIMVC
ncbi:hypothetical protein AB6A40_011730 [Gnathostoma spinigerum]|uniref:C2H2-type domain-containing protein n=1 Tax=Gnathostoma spinigerum TaxID=75299 RepID=A0ABD6EZV7_9BILA